MLLVVSESWITKYPASYPSTVEEDWVTYSPITFAVGEVVDAILVDDDFNLACFKSTVPEEPTVFAIATWTVLTTEVVPIPACVWLGNQSNLILDPSIYAE